MVWDSGLEFGSRYVLDRLSLGYTRNVRDVEGECWPFSQGIKRSVTNLRGGTLGYAEIVAIKVSPL